MDFAFNELSEINIRSAEDLDSFYNQILELIKMTNLQNFPSVIFTDDFASKNFNGLGTAYTLIRDSKLQKDEYEHFLSIIVNAPFSYVFQEVNDQFFYDSLEVKGLQYSCIHNVRSISIPGPNWSEYEYLVDKTSINAFTADLTSRQISVEHLGDLSYYGGTWLEAYLPVLSFNNAKTFLENIPQKYPNVILSDNAKSGLAGFNQGKLNQLERSMRIFQDYCNDKWEGPFKRQVLTKLGVAVKDESEQTMSKYGEQRVFLNEVGMKEIIPLHFNISDDFRGNIKPTENNEIFIAYLGPHLSTVKYK